MAYQHIGVLTDATETANDALAQLTKWQQIVPIASQKDAKNVDVLVVLGGDGFMLHSLHEYMQCGLPIYGMNCGTVGFLMNSFSEAELLARINHAVETRIHPLSMKVTTSKGKVHEALAINEVSLLRHSGQAAHIRVSIDDTVKLEHMISDGVLVATPAGSSAYNASAGGPIIPIRSQLLAITPLSIFRPRRWRGAVVPDRVTITFDILDSAKRPVNAVADFNEFSHAETVEVKKAEDMPITLLFDQGHSLEDRILREQFTI